MRLEAWEGKYWHASQIILDTFNSSLEEWLGADQARAPKERVAEVEKALVQAAVRRVEQSREHFEHRFTKKEREKVIAKSKGKERYHYPSLFSSLGDHAWPVDCPACTGRAFLSGMRYDEEILEPDPQADEEEVVVYYGADELRCPVCDLHLDSRVEIEAAGVEPDREETEFRDRQYEPDYGNC